MNHLELRTQLTQMVGDYALVGQDTSVPSAIVPDYAVDGGAQIGTLSRLVNDAIRTTVDKLPSLFDEESYLCRLSEGEYRLQVPAYRKFNRAELFVAGQSRGELCKSSMRELRQDYSEDWATHDSGEPEFIAPGQLRSRQPNLAPANYLNVDDIADLEIPGGLVGGDGLITDDGQGIVFPPLTLTAFIYYLVATSAWPASRYTGPLSLSFRVSHEGPASVENFVTVNYKGVYTDTYTELAVITEPGEYAFPINADGVSVFSFIPSTDGESQLATITIDRIELRQTGTDSFFTSPHSDYFVTMPPANGDYEIRVWAWFYPDPLVGMYDRNEVTDKFYRLVLLLAATQWATDKGHEGLTNHWGTQANRELMERLRDIGARQLAEIEDQDGRIDWVD